MWAANSTGLQRLQSAALDTRKRRGISRGWRVSQNKTPSRQVTALLAKMAEFEPGNLYKGERGELTCEGCSLISTYMPCCAMTYHVYEPPFPYEVIYTGYGKSGCENIFAGDLHSTPCYLMILDSVSSCEMHSKEGNLYHQGN